MESAFRFQYETGTTTLADAVDHYFPRKRRAYGSQTLLTTMRSRTLVSQIFSLFGLSELYWTTRFFETRLTQIILLRPKYKRS